MVSCLVTMVVATALGQQAPDQAGWLKVIPADVDVIARMVPLKKGQADLIAMIKAMSPTLANRAEPVLTAAEPLVTGLLGKAGNAEPIMGVLKLPKPGEVPIWAVLVKSDDYAGVLKTVSHKADLKPKSLGGYDSFETGNGLTLFAMKGAGFVALGADEGLIKAMAKPATTIDSRITGDIQAQFFAGDIGIFLNVAAIQAHFGEQIDQIKAAALANAEQGAAVMNNKMGDALKGLLEGLFDGIKTGDSLAINVDFAPEGLTIGGRATINPDVAASRPAPPKPGEGNMLGRLPGDATTFVYLNLNSGAMAGFQKLSMAYMIGGDKPSPELQRALDQQRELAGETYIATTAGAIPTTLNVTDPPDPKKAVETATTVLKTIASPEGMVKSVSVEPNAQTYKGYTLNRSVATLNLEKMLPPNMPGGVEALKKQLGGDTASSWYGTDGKLMISVATRTWDEAKAQIDALTDGKNALAASANYQALRAKLPRQTSAMMLISAQGVVKLMAGQKAMITGAEPDIPADMPRETTFLGGAVVVRPDGFSFTFLAPSNNGPVFEKGLAPIFQGMQGRANP